MVRHLSTGAASKLGQDPQRALSGRNASTARRAGLDVTHHPADDGHDVHINTSVCTRKDDAEPNGAAAFAFNETGAGNLAIAAAKGERLLVAAIPAGTCIVRTAWPCRAAGSNSTATMQGIAASHDTVSVVTGPPTWTGDLAGQIVELSNVDAPASLQHATNSGEASWFDFTRESFTVAEFQPRWVATTTSAKYVSPAPRPGYCVLCHDAWARLGISPMRDRCAVLSPAQSFGALTMLPAA